MATHHPAETSTATPAISRPRSRRRKLPAPATSSAKANPGTTRKTWSCLVRNPRPDGDAGEDVPAEAVLLDGAQRGVGAQHHQQREQRVGVVEPEHQGGHRRERDRQPGERGRRPA